MIRVKDIITRINSSSISRRMGQGLVWSFTGTALAKFLTLLVGIICAHILQKEAYGEFSMVRSTINMFIVLGSAGLGVTSTKYIAEYREKQADKIPAVYAATNYFGLLMAIITAILILLGAPFIANNILHHPSIVLPVRVGAVLLFFSIINGVQNGALMGFENFKAIAINTLLGSVLESVLTVLGAYYFGVNGAILGFGMGFILIFVTNHLSINKNFSAIHIKKLSIKKLHLKDFSILYTYSLPAALSALLITPSFWLIRSILVRAEGFQELAVFEAADQWKVIILFVPTAFSQIVLPILSSLHKEKTTFVSTLKYNMLIVGFTALLLSIGVMLFGGFIMRLYGATYDNSVPVQILAISTIFSALANVLEMAVYSLGKMWQCFAINIVWALLMVGCSYYLCMRGEGANGLSMAVLISYVVSFLMFLVYTIIVVRKEVK